MVYLFLQLQFLFELPNRMKKCIEMKQFVLAVRLVIFFESVCSVVEAVSDKFKITSAVWNRKSVLQG